MSLLLPLAALGIITALWLGAVSVAKPRLLLYTLMALSPTQFLFIPVADFFLSPADVLIGVATFGLLLRLATLQQRGWLAVHQHQFLFLMIAAYLGSFVVLGVFSRTLIRLPIGIILSILACELLQTRRQLSRAAHALVVAGTIDAAYGLYFIARGTPLHPTRFSGMSDVNFSAMVIATAAAVALARLTGSRRRLPLLRPGALAAIALATLSQMGIIAILSAWVTLLRRVVSRLNKIRVVAASALIVAIALSAAPVREGLLRRNVREVESDGVARNSADVRWMILGAAWQGFKTSPVIGLGYFQFAAFSNIDPVIEASTNGVGYPTHNTYVEVLVEGGLVAFALFVLHWRQYVRGLPRVIRAVARRRDAVAAACLVGFPVVMVCAALANLLLVYSFWAVCGLTLACLNLLAREEGQQAFTPVGGGPSDAAVADGAHFTR